MVLSLSLMAKGFLKASILVCASIVELQEDVAFPSVLPFNWGKNVFFLFVGPKEFIFCLSYYRMK